MPRPYASAALDDEVAFRPKRGKALWIVLAVLTLAGIAAAVFVLGGVPQNPAPAFPTPPSLPASQESRGTSEVEPSAAAASNPQSAESTEGSAPDSAAPSEPPPSAPLPGDGASSNNGAFADLFAAGAKRAQGAPSGRFDAQAAKAALDALMSETARCRERGGPSGMTRVVVTFGPSGNVSNAVVSDPPFAGSRTGECIANVMKRATVKPFAGSPSDITQRISLR